MFIDLLACLFSMTCPHARLKRQLASRPPFQINTQRSNVKGKVTGVQHVHIKLFFFFFSYSSISSASMHPHSQSVEVVEGVGTERRRWKDTKEARGVNEVTKQAAK